MKIVLVSLDFKDLGAFSAVRGFLQDRFDASLESLVLPVPERAFNPLRGQYHAGVIVQELLNKVREGEYLIALVSGDLYVDGFNFVFGLADPSYRVAVVSDARLRQEFYGLPPDRELHLSRFKKEVLHELGHLLGLPHCPDARCVMHFSNTLEDTDRKEAEFCDSCRAKILPYLRKD